MNQMQLLPTITDEVLNLYKLLVRKTCEGDGLADAQREQGVGVAPLAARPALGKLLKSLHLLKQRQIETNLAPEHKAGQVLNPRPS